MENGFVEIGITDYLHEVELWRNQLRRWELGLPWPEGAACALCVESLLQLGDELTSLCVLLREQQRGLVSAPTAEPIFPREDVETRLGLTIWRIMREEERLAQVLPATGTPMPPALPRARLRMERT